jgi:hypothetical protein
LQHALVGSALNSRSSGRNYNKRQLNPRQRPRCDLGILGAVCGGLGVTLAIQNAFDRVWAVPRYAPHLVISRLRGLVLFVLFGAVIVMTTALSAVGPAADGFGYGLGTGVRIAAPAVAVNVAVFVIGFRVLTVRDVELADLLPAAISAAVAVQVLQTVGVIPRSGTLRRVAGLWGVRAGVRVAGLAVSAGGHCGVLRRDQHGAGAAAMAPQPAHPLRRRRSAHPR